MALDLPAHPRPTTAARPILALQPAGIAQHAGLLWDARLRLLKARYTTFATPVRG